MAETFQYHLVGGCHGTLRWHIQAHLINWSDLLTSMAHNATLIAHVCHLNVIFGSADARNMCHRPLCAILVWQKNVSF